MRGDAPLRASLDATPLLGRQTGIGVFCAQALMALNDRPDVDVSAFAVSWRRRQGIIPLVPRGVRTQQRAMPARPLHAAWTHFDAPPIEWFVGEVDVVHGTNFIVPPTRRGAAVMTLHDLTPLHHPELSDGVSVSYPERIRRALRRGTWVHTPSQFVADEVIESFGADPARVRAVHSGVPVTAADGPLDDEGAQRLLPTGTTDIVLSLSTAEPRKDLPGLVAAFDLIAAERPGLTLVLAGPPGWGEESLSEAIGRSSFAGRIVRTGWISAAVKRALLSRASLLAYPSLYEGFGFPPLEAMAVGTPVVATRVGALPEVLGDAALLVEARDVEALAEALARVLDDPAVRQDLIARGSGRVGQFTWTRCAEGLVGLYRDAVAERRS
jgi:glycosyltransferase involved in cell wall biosynthesis